MADPKEGATWAARKQYLGVGACDVCWTASWVPVAASDPDAREVIGGELKGSHVRCDFCFLTSQVAETRMVLRQAYAVDEPISTPDLARKVVAKVVKGDDDRPMIDVANLGRD